jgi:lysophospholipase L1-like esterase
LACGVLIALVCIAHANADPSRLIQNLQAGMSQTVVTYGTSLTASEWPNQLNAWLQTAFPGQVQLVNSGKPFMSSQNVNPFIDALNLLDTRVLSHNPNTVFLEFAINDALTGNNISPQQSRANLNTMIDRILENHSDREIILMTMNPAWDPPDNISGSSARPNLAEYYQGYRDVAAERGLLLIDHYPHWVELRDTNPTLFKQYIPDGVHPTAAALAEIVTPAIISGLIAPEPVSANLALVGAWLALIGRRNSFRRSPIQKACPIWHAKSRVPDSNRQAARC